MIRALFFSNGDSCGFEIIGHAGLGTSGNDVVCAAVSSAAYMAANTVTDVLSVSAQAEVDEGRMSFSFAPGDSAAQAVIDGLRLHLEALESEYPKQLKVITEV